MSDGSTAKAAPIKAGFAALIGRPNVGKSTLLNRLIGEKIAIVSPKPQTTRNRILGVVTRPEGQVAFLDTPGIHQAKGALNKLMVETALTAANECDVVLFMIEADASGVSQGNQLVVKQLQRLKKPVILVINKIDEIKKAMLLPLIAQWKDVLPFAEVVPISAREGDGVEQLFALVAKLMPETPEPLFPADVFTDQAERTLVAELIREQVLRHCREEIPYSTAVVVEVFDESDRETGKQGLVRIDAAIFVEREGQKAIVIGKRGAMLKTIGTDARKSIERLLGCKVFLALRVKLEERWSDNLRGLRKMGYSQ
ncbi:MAG: GTPase Era [Archangiaceae bacterium]|nr:GTPase Era [Archangiaceae bacterium]